MSEKKTRGQELAEKLNWKTEDIWEKASDDEKADITRFADFYKQYLDAGKTERRCAAASVDILKAHGFVDLDSLKQSGAKLQAGTAVYRVIREKSVLAAVVGRNGVEAGVNIVGAHIDSPRIDLKSNPLYEDTGLAFLDTRYYGGIKYYQWTASPLALYGVVHDADGKRLDVSWGDGEGESVFCIPDLLPHLAREQMKKTASEFIDGESLDILAGSQAYPDEKADEKVKLNLLNILHEKYNITEKSLFNAELSFVPAGHARDLGFDHSMLGAYGHDDRSCAYTALRGLLDAACAQERYEKTSVLFLIDKEEVNGYRPYLPAFAAFLCDLTGIAPTAPIEEIATCSSMLSADVGAAFDPSYADVYDKRTAPQLGKGLSITKAETGNFADIDFCQRVEDLFDRAGVFWQAGGMGKIGKGGGGTIARAFSEMGIASLDCGVPVLSMHSPFEVISKADLWDAYKGYSAFFKG